MTNTNLQPSPAPDKSSTFDRLAPYAQQIGYGMIGVGVALSLIPIVSVYQSRQQYLPLIIWGAFLSLLFLGCGIGYSIPREKMRYTEADTLRLLVLVLGGLAGFATAVFGLALPMYQYHDELSGGLQAWREQRVPLSLSALAFLGGLVLMLFGLMQARAYERVRPGLRQLLYGYNAVLGGLLLFCILALVNILPYSPVWPLSAFGKQLDWSKGGKFSIEPSTLGLLQSLNKPLKIYVLLTDRDDLDEQTAFLLNQCRSANGLVSWETVSRDLSPDKWKELEKSYKIPSGGLLLVYGTPPDELFEHIKSSDIWKTKMRGDGSQQAIFQGEYALKNAIAYLSEGKSRPTIYFTQGNGELTFQNFGPGERSESMGMFIESLGKGNYDLKPLPFDRQALTQSKTIPDDAEVVVIAGPKTALTQDAIDTLRKYLRTPRGPNKKKGKLIVLFDLIVDEQKNTMIQTGLESLLREYSVTVGNSYVMSVKDDGASREVIAATNPNNKSPIGPAFNDKQRHVFPFFFKDVRPVEPVKTPPAPQGGGALAEADTLLVSIVAEELQLTWPEPDLVTPPELLLNKLKRGDRQIQQVSLGVTVTEPKESADLPMGHPSPEQTPRMVVIGDTRWLADDNPSKLRPGNVALFSSCLSWLRERPDIGQPPESKDRETYSLVGVDAAAGDRLKKLPGVLMVLGIVTLGGGIWVVRRR